jgi:transcriptional regulator with XRE-family HTH domain
MKPSAIDNLARLVEERDTLGEAIKAARSEVGLSGEALATALGLRDESSTSMTGTSQIYAWEKGGRVPRPDTLQRLVQVLRQLAGHKGELDSEVARLGKESRQVAKKQRVAEAAAAASASAAASVASATARRESPKRKAN